jgi:hypothetical protein
VGYVVKRGMTCANIDLRALALRWRCWQTRPDLQVYGHRCWRGANGLDATVGFPPSRPPEASRGTLTSVQVILCLPTGCHHSPVRSELSVGAGREPILPLAQTGQCHRGANVQRAGQAGFAHISHVPRYDLIREMSIGRGAELSLVGTSNGARELIFVRITCSMQGAGRSVPGPSRGSPDTMRT